MAETPKVCSVCGMDVSGKPRTKDAQGRYICAECIEKAKQTKQVQQNPPKSPAAPTPPSEGDNSFILDIGGKSVGTKGGTPCPNCGRVMTHDAVVCIGCGFNTGIGKQMQIKVQKVKKPKGERASAEPGALGNLLSFLNASPILFAGAYLAIVGGLIWGGLAAQNEMMVGFGFLVYVVIGLIVYITVAVFAFKDDGAGYGIGCLICGFVQAYWVLKECERDVIKYTWVAAAAITISLRFVMPFIESAGMFK